jgi:putative sugar O-methyltransferase
MRRSRESRGVLLGMAAVTALLCNFLMQEHALTLMTSLPFWILGAVAVRAAEPYAAATASFVPRTRRVRVDPVELDLAPHAVDVSPEIAELAALVDLADSAGGAPTGSARAYTSLTETPAPPMIHVVEHRRGSEQAEDDPELLELMLADLAAAPAVFQPARATAQHFQAAISALREGLTDFRRRSFSDCDGAATGLLVANVDTLPALEAALASCRADYARMTDLESIDHLDVSRVGDPEGFETDGRFLTAEAVNAYRRYVFVNEFIDVNDMDLVVMLGPSAAEQAEVLKQLYPHLTIAILDEPAGLYKADRFLSAARPHDVMPYRSTRGEGTPTLKRRKVHFLGHHRLGELPRTKRQLVWVAGFFDELDARAARNYGELLTNAGDYLYMSAEVSGDLALHERTQEQVLNGFQLVERRTTPEGAEDTFWKRRRKL